MLNMIVPVLKFKLLIFQVHVVIYLYMKVELEIFGDSMSHINEGRTQGVRKGEV